MFCWNNFLMLGLGCCNLLASSAYLTCPYDENITKHKQHFFSWIHANSPYLETEYSRVFLTVNCTDVDEIPRCSDAGRIFHNEFGSYQCMHNGIKIITDGYCGVWMTDLIFGLQGFHEPQEEKVFYEVLQYIPSKAVMIELGSYWAYYSLWFAKSIQEPTNYLIEPDLSYLELGKQNFALNGCDGLFFHGYAGQCFSRDTPFPNAEYIHIDDFLKMHDIDHVHILHADIQGAEYEMLLSASRALDQKLIDYCFISTHSEDLHQKCLQFLGAKDYRLIAHHTLSESYSVDGLIVAKRPNLVGPDTIEISKR